MPKHNASEFNTHQGQILIVDGTYNISKFQNLAPTNMAFERACSSRYNKINLAAFQHHS